MLKFEPDEVYQDSQESPAYAFVSVNLGQRGQSNKGLRIAVIGDTTFEAVELREHVLDKLNE
ncbi:MAG: hypothetical protein AAF434_08655 [Pseudomonadota bacterium]